MSELKLFQNKLFLKIQRQTRQYPKTKCGIIKGHRLTAVKTIGMLGHPSTAFKHVLHEISVFDRNSNAQQTIIQEQNN